MDFWVAIYSQYTTKQGLIHDAKYVDKVYEVVDFARLGRNPGPQIREIKKKWKEVLFSLHKKGEKNGSLTEDEKKVKALFADVQEPNKFQDAARPKRIRFQLGQKDRFLEGLKQSGRYLSIMEEIFRKQGLPLELTRLPFVESSFNLEARSKVGASGIWQFMPSTGRLFLEINDAVDERNDPIRATEAAARLLRSNYESLGKWRLAVTAYNHGRSGMMNAVKSIESEELEDMVQEYRGSAFGFASMNFFTEFLAAVEVERNAERHFGQVERLPVLRYYEAVIPDFIELWQLARFMRLDAKDLRELNPGLTDAVFEGKRLIPAGYKLRLPADQNLESESAARVFITGYSHIPKVYKRKRQPGEKYVRRPKTQSQRQ